MADLDAHARPPIHLHSIYKKYQKISQIDLDQDGEVVDMSKSCHGSVQALYEISSAPLADIFDLPADWPGRHRSVKVFEFEAIPGLQIIPGLLDSVAQRELLDRVLHRDMANRRHKNNVGLHYHIPYEACGQLSHPDQAARGGSKACDEPTDKVTSFFTCPPTSDVVMRPFDPRVHRDLTISQFLNRKLRWFTMGGQYDWTRKVYPTAQADPSFPSDIAAAVTALFPEMRPEAAICNLYTPGDTLSLHRDVSEEAAAGLVSISIGCDAIFVVGTQTGESTEEAGVTAAVMRLRSGDAIYMSGSARYAWHGVPQVIRDTCPVELASWPDCYPRKEGPSAAAFEQWQDWLARKRINLNVRQMRA